MTCAHTPKRGTRSEQDPPAKSRTESATFTSPEMNIDMNFSVYPSLTDGGRIRTDGNIRIRWELVTDLFWDVTAWITTDNQAENTDTTTDYSISTGIGWNF